MKKKQKLNPDFFKSIDKIERAKMVYQTDVYSGVISPKWSIKRMIEENYGEEEAFKLLKDIKRYVSINTNKTFKILDMGCGFGDFVLVCLRRGLNCYGFEIDKRLVKISKSILKINNYDGERIFLGGKKLNFGKCEFDLINFHYVLEHVQDIPKLLQQVNVILKQKGKVFIIVPNYKICYDTHYGCFVFPFLSKFVNKPFLRLCGRKNLDFYDSLNFVTPYYLEKLFRQYHFSYEAIGKERWFDDIDQLNFEHRSIVLRHILSILKKLKCEKLLKIAADFGFYSPLVYILEKE